MLVWVQVVFFLVRCLFSCVSFSVLQFLLFFLACTFVYMFCIQRQYMTTTEFRSKPSSFCCREVVWNIVKKVITSNMQWDYELLDHKVHCNCRRQRRIWLQAPQHRTAWQSKSHPQAARRSLYRFKVDWRKQTKTHWSHVTPDTQMDRVL